MWTLDAGEVRHEAVMYPNLDIEDLSHAKNFMILLGVRARTHPQEFMVEGASVITTAILCTDLAGIYLKNYRVKFNRSSTIGHATLEPLDSEPKDCRELLTTAHQVEANVLALGLQEKVLGVLLAMCKIILHDIDCASPSALVP